MSIEPHDSIESDLLFCSLPDGNGGEWSLIHSADRHDQAEELEVKQKPGTRCVVSFRSILRLE
jgi:hypothetical protein